MGYNIIRPRRGIKSLWDKHKGRIYAQGEMLVESPESGVGTGPVNIKFGDGTTDYENLPYAVLAPTDEIVEGGKAPMTAGAGYELKQMIESGLSGGEEAQQAAINSAKDEAINTSKEYTNTKVSELINGAPSTLDTLKEIADAMAENEDVVEALEVAIGNKSEKGHKHTKSEISDFPSTMTPSAHNQSASTITAGIFGGKVQANVSAMATLTNPQLRDSVILDTDPGEGATVSYSPGTIVWTK